MLIIVHRFVRCNASSLNKWPTVGVYLNGPVKLYWRCSVKQHMYIWTQGPNQRKWSNYCHVSNVGQSPLPICMCTRFDIVWSQFGESSQSGDADGSVCNCLTLLKPCISHHCKHLFASGCFNCQMYQAKSDESGLLDKVYEVCGGLCRLSDNANCGHDSWHILPRQHAAHVTRYWNLNTTLNAWHPESSSYLTNWRTSVGS